MAAHAFVGTWEIIGCISHGNHNDTNGLEGVRVRLDETGDVTWFNVSEEAQSIPLFSCETYELYMNSVMGLHLRFGAYAGHVIEFLAGEPRDIVILTCEGWCMLRCKRITEDLTETSVEAPFSLLPALEDGYFSDLVITASNNKEFQVHTSILQLNGSNIDWSFQPPPLSGLPEPVLGTILHWLYAECLPANLSEATAHQVITAASSYPCLKKLVDICQLYLKNMALKQQIIGLVSDMHACGAQIIEHFNCRNSQSSSDNITSNPAKLCYVIKQSVREAAVAGAKLLLLCDLFTKRKSELSREERHEIIRYAKSRLPIFMSQLHRFLQAVKSTFSSMSTAQRQEVATYLVPEIEVILDTVSNLILGVKGALEQIIQVLSPADGSRPHKSGSMSDVLGRSLRTVLHVRELTKLRNFHEHVTCSLGLLLHKRESFNDMTGTQKVRSVARNLEQLIEELPIFMLKLEEVTVALDEKLEWREFKFCFKVGTSKVSGVLQKLLSHRETLQNVLRSVCELVQRDTFTQSLVMLGLLDPAQCGTTHASDNAPSRSETSGTPKQHGYKLNLVESLCVPPTSATSNLSKKALQLLRSGKSADMIFEVANSQDPGGQSPQAQDPVSPINDTNNDQANSIKAHRVIVAARCDWFRRALLSGMREAIDRKIIVHDTSPFLFRVFLDYLYSGKLAPSALTTEQLADLMLLSDRYELDALKQACENGLRKHIDEDSVLYFLSMADQFNAKCLRATCITFITHHPDVIESELFSELPPGLQAELYDLALWARPLSSRPTSGVPAVAEQLLPNSGSEGFTSTTLADLEEMAGNMHVGHREGEMSNSSSLEELSLTHDIARLESCIAQLRDIVGGDVSREKLVQVALAADYDVNRAINFYYSS